jgi:hypothetical protein
MTSPPVDLFDFDTARQQSAAVFKSLKKFETETALTPNNQVTQHNQAYLVLPASSVTATTTPDVHPHSSLSFRTTRHQEGLFLSLYTSFQDASSGILVVIIIIVVGIVKIIVCSIIIMAKQKKGNNTFVFR